MATTSPHKLIVEWPEKRRKENRSAKVDFQMNPDPDRELKFKSFDAALYSPQEI